MTSYMTYNLWCHVILKLHQWVKLCITTVHHMIQTTWRHQYKISRDENHYSKKTGTELQYESFIIEFQMTRNRQKGEIQIAGFAPTRLIIFLCHADWLAEINKFPDSKCWPIRWWKIEMITRLGANPSIWISPFCGFRVIWNSMIQDSYCNLQIFGFISTESQYILIFRIKIELISFENDIWVTLEEFLLQTLMRRY